MQSSGASPPTTSSFGGLFHNVCGGSVDFYGGCDATVERELTARARADMKWTAERCTPQHDDDLVLEHADRSNATRHALVELQRDDAGWR